MKEFGKQWRLTAEIILIAAVCMAGMWQNTKKTIESISDVKKKEEQMLSQRIMGFDAYTWNKRYSGTARIVGFKHPVRLI